MVFLHRAEISGSGGAPFAWTEGTLSEHHSPHFAEGFCLCYNSKGKIFRPPVFYAFLAKKRVDLSRILSAAFREQ